MNHGASDGTTDLTVELLQRIAHPEPELIWGLLSRGVGLTFLVAFVSLYPQLTTIAGRRGLLPVDAALRAIERDFSAPKRFFYFPTLLWFNSGDNALRLVCLSGIAAAAVAVVGGPWTPWAFAVCYASYLSLDRAMTLIYPWDAVLLEAGFWAIFLPATQPAPSILALEPPLPAVAWAYRLIMFRVIFGFGKHKFIGTTPQDSGFLKGFLVSQPLPTPLGWLAQKMPLFVMKLGLLVMFLIEIPLPFAVFFPGAWSAFAGMAILGLMAIIWLTGNFGHFNMVSMVLTLSWFDSTTAQRFSLATLFAPGQPLLVHVYFVLHSGLALLSLPFNTFCSYTWMNWSPLTRLRPRCLAWPAALARVVAPFRLVHAYGVFPPQAGPGARPTVVAEATWDDEHWHELRFRFFPTQETSAPRFCAPHHERFDQAIVYETFALNEASPYRNGIGRWDPYGHGGASAPWLLQRRVLEASLPGNRIYDRTLEQKWGAPSAVRVRTHLLEPVGFAELRRSGRWWKRTLIGPHLPLMRAQDDGWEAPLPPPELWHFDDVIWLIRSRFGRLMKRAGDGEDPHSLVPDDTTELSAADIVLFWDDFVPMLRERHGASWSGLRATVEALRVQHGRARLYRLERIGNRYAALLFARLDPVFKRQGLRPVFGREVPLLRVRSNYQLRQLTMHIVLQGRKTYDAVMAEAAEGGYGRAVAEAERMTMYSGSLFHAVFRYELLVYQSQKFRMLEHMDQWRRPEPTSASGLFLQRFIEIASGLWGALEFIEFLKTQFCGPEDRLDDVSEHWPLHRITEHGEVFVAWEADVPAATAGDE